MPRRPRESARYGRLSPLGRHRRPVLRSRTPGNWLASKIPTLPAIAYIDILRFGIAPDEAARLLVSALISICCVAIYGHVVNDIFDLEADRLANKVNRLAAMRPTRRLLLT